MKKIFLTMFGLVAAATLVHAQGFIIVQSTAANIQTNTALFGSTTQQSPFYATAAAGKTVTSSGAFDYALLWSTTSISDGPTDPGWTLTTQNGGSALVMNNYVVGGGISGTGTSACVAVNMAAGTTYFVQLVGWSSNLGSTWSSVESQLASGNWNSAAGFFGETGVSTMTPFATAGTGDPFIFPTAYPNGSLTLFAVPVPEPTTLALAGLGGLSMMFLRRRKS
jgi:hypothetical protein